MYVKMKKRKMSYKQLDEFFLGAAPESSVATSAENVERAIPPEAAAEQGGVAAPNEECQARSFCVSCGGPCQAPPTWQRKRKNREQDHEKQ